tara:strand:- start:168 stop:407 length:240 start_codon:yes stop_codon:yes gene_type:complete
MSCKSFAPADFNICFYIDYIKKKREEMNQTEDKAVKKQLLDACKNALEYLEANKGEYGTESRIMQCRLAILKAEKVWYK